MNFKRPRCIPLSRGSDTASFTHTDVEFFIWSEEMTQICCDLIVKWQWIYFTHTHTLSPSLVAPQCFPKQCRARVRCFLCICIGQGPAILAAGLWCSAQRKEESHNSSCACLSSLAGFHRRVYTLRSKTCVNGRGSGSNVFRPNNSFNSQRVYDTVMNLHCCQ